MLSRRQFSKALAFLGLGGASAQAVQQASASPTTIEPVIVENVLFKPMHVFDIVQTLVPSVESPDGLHGKIAVIRSREDYPIYAQNGGWDDKDYSEDLEFFGEAIAFVAVRKGVRCKQPSCPCRQIDQTEAVVRVISKGNGFRDYEEELDGKNQEYLDRHRRPCVLCGETKDTIGFFHQKFVTEKWHGRTNSSQPRIQTIHQNVWGRLRLYECCYTGEKEFTESFVPGVECTRHSNHCTNRHLIRNDSLSLNGNLIERAAHKELLERA